MMSYKANEFKEYFLTKVHAAPNTVNTYNSYLQRIDRTLGGLDEKVAKDGMEAVLGWSRDTSEPPFDTYPSQARSVLKRYLNFLIDLQSPEDELTEDDSTVSEEEPKGLAFRLEKEMHVAVRRQLGNLEDGLVEADNGSETSVATGYIDIVARDKAGKLVVIELKAGRCPAGALEQALGYAQSLSEERNEEVRVMLIASEFPDRIRAAAKRTTGLVLVTYEFSLKFTEIK